MAYTEQDEKDLRAIVKQRKDNPISSFLSDSDEYKRQFGKGKREATAAPMGNQSVIDKRMKDAGMKCGGEVKKYAKGGAVRGDGVAQRGKTKGKFV